jgi:hypothetical protein
MQTNVCFMMSLLAVDFDKPERETGKMGGFGSGPQGGRRATVREVASVGVTEALARFGGREDRLTGLGFNGQTVAIEWVPCGRGHRAWWLCPFCHRRCGRLYLVSHGLLCRRCSGLGYFSQLEDRMERLWRRMRAIRLRLDPTEDRGAPYDPLPPKPPRMHWQTYERLRSRYYDLCSERDRVFGFEAARRFGGFLAGS